MDTDDVERDYQLYKHVVDLWARENPIKTNKLQVLLVVNGLLVSAVNINGGFISKDWPVYLGGAVFSLIWVLSAEPLFFSGSGRPRSTGLQKSTRMTRAFRHTSIPVRFKKSPDFCGSLAARPRNTTSWLHLLSFV